MESKTRVKSPEELCIIGSLLHFFSNFERQILFADAILYFQVVLYVREMPPYELPLKVFLCDPRGLNRHFCATSASLGIEDRASTQPLSSQNIHRL